MNDLSTSGLGFLGLTVAFAWANPLFWISLLVTLWRGWSLEKTAGLGAGSAIVWGFIMYSIQHHMAPEVMASSDEWTLRLVLMVVLSIIWITVITYVVRSIWRWAKFLVGHLPTGTRATYEKARGAAPGILEQARNGYQAYVGGNTATKGDDNAFEIAGKELRINRPVESVWARALMLADGDSERAKSKYIQLRVEQISRFKDQATNS